MELSTIILIIAVSILWLNAGVRATREMNDIDNDAAEWLTFPLPLKIVTILIAPVLILVFDRHILDTKRKK